MAAVRPSFCMPSTESTAPPSPNHRFPYPKYTNAAKESPRAIQAADHPSASRTSTARAFRWNTPRSRNSRTRMNPRNASQIPVIRDPYASVRKTEYSLSSNDLSRSDTAFSSPLSSHTPSHAEHQSTLIERYSISTRFMPHLGHFM